MGADVDNTQKTPALEQFSQVPDSTSQATEDILIPYFAGRRRIKASWISPAYNAKSVKVSTSSGGSGKGQSDSADSGQYKYYADFIALVAMGPCDNITAVYVDNNIAWTGGVNYHGAIVDAISLGVFGVMWMWWGTAGQTAPNLFNHGADLYSGHRGKVRLEFKQLYFGAIGKTSAPNIEVVIERYPDFPGFTHGDASLGVSAVGCSPIAIIYEMLNNSQYGCGIPQARFDISYITSQITAQAATGLRIAPLIDSQQPVRSVIQDICSYFDGFVRKVNGLIQIGYYQHSASLGGSAPTLNYDNSTEAVKFVPAGFTKTVNEVKVSWTNRTQFYQTSTVRAASTANRTLTGIPRNVELQKPHIVDPTVAASYVWEYLRFFSNPSVTGSGTYTKESIQSLYAGDLAWVTNGEYGAEILARITSKTWGEDSSGTCDIEFEQERGTFDQNYSNPYPYADNNVYVNPALITKSRIVQLPAGLRNQPYIQIGILAERSSTTDLGFMPWISSDNVTFSSTGRPCYFAARGTLQSTTGATFTPGAYDATGFVVSLTGVDASEVVNMTFDQTANITMLIFIDNELMSNYLVTALGGNQYRINPLRAVQGSVSTIHRPGADVWFIRRDHLFPIGWSSFVNGATFYFKLQGYTQYSVFNLALAGSISFTVGGGLSDLQGPTNLSIGLNSQDSKLVFSWTSDTSSFVVGYQIRYGPLGGNFQQAKVMVDVYTNHIVTAKTPPGTWVFYVASYDANGILSSSVASAVFTVPTLYVLVERNYGFPQHALDAGAVADYNWGTGIAGMSLVNCTVHPTSYNLVPVSGKPASYVGPDSGFDIFDNFCLNPPAFCTYVSPVLDSLGVGTTIRASAATYEYLAGLAGIPPSGLVLSNTLQPEWTDAGVTITNGSIHPTAYVVVPASTHSAAYVPSGGDGFELFDNFVYSPTTTTTVSYIIDNGSSYPFTADLSSNLLPGYDGLTPSSTATIALSSDNVTYNTQVTGNGSGSISFNGVGRYLKYSVVMNNATTVSQIASMVPTSTIGPPIYWTEIDGQMRTSPDNVTWSDWTEEPSQFTTDEYVQYQATWNPVGSLVPVGLESVWLCLDAPSVQSSDLNVPVAIGGTTITYPTPYRQQLPVINITATGSSSLIPMITAQSLTSFTVRVFNSSGTDVGGSIHWTASGV